MKTLRNFIMGLYAEIYMLKDLQEDISKKVKKWQSQKKIQKQAKLLE